ncbi:hypothetical protein FACS1894132_01140 [Clostridia bacterium]|nr:hypothetical protein FACS1894132_01140 [Clostridia bacterium]
MPSISSVDTSDQRQYLDMLNSNMDVKNGSTSKTKKIYDMVVDNKKESEVGFKDLFQLMINQLTNQDFMNPQDDSQYLAQMTQIASMSATQQLSRYSQAQYMSGFIGKEVTISKYEIGGDVVTETGVVSSVSWDSNYENYKYTVNGKQYDITDIKNLALPGTSSKEAPVDPNAEVVDLLKKNNDSLNKFISNMDDNAENSAAVLDLLKTNNATIASVLAAINGNNNNSASGDQDSSSEEPESGN